MNKALIILAFIIIGFLFLMFIGSMHLYSVGHNDPVAVDASNRYFANILLSAEYRNGTDYYTIDLLNFNTIQISAGNKFGGERIEPQYHISGDTILILEKKPLRAYPKNKELQKME